MEEDVGAKAPVTRLRRRLSVEQSEEVKSPSAPSTPSKKRGGRLAAKPQLELIDENASENAPKRQTKKSTAKDVIETNEEKILTPSRRSTRIKSNTSIVSDTPQSFDSPRAKRAARRSSHIGSDNEAPLTPVIQTRRTRKDSTSSIDKQDNQKESSVKKSAVVADSFVEEVESNSQITTKNEKSEITPKRKSPRLQKKNKQSDTDTENEDIQQNNNNTPETNKTSKNKISDDSFKLINSLDDRPVKKTQLNNSTSSVNSTKTRRNRTNTWAAVQNDNSNGVEQYNPEIEEKSDENNSVKNTSSNKINAEFEIENKDSLNSSESNKMRSSVSSANPILDNVSVGKSITVTPRLSKTNDTELAENTVLNETEKLFEKPPVAVVQSLIYFDDSDSDRGKPVSDKAGDSEDQCVPVVPEINQNSAHDSILKQNENAKVSYNDTCEPMDIDETMPTNVSLINSSNCNQDKDTHEILETSKDQKSNLGDNIKSPNKSKRESTSSLSTSQNNDKTCNENKNTLILSQLKDLSTNDNSLTKSPKANPLKDISTNEHSVPKSPKTAVEVLSKSVTDINKDKATNKRDSLTYMTSTPLQQKNLTKMAMQINTSVIDNSNNESLQQSLTNKNNVSKQSNRSTEVSSSEESDSDNVSTKDKSDFLNAEAEEATDDYESGDSQDEEERQYVKENEILEKGETLDSDDDGSNDTDYEKDSFVVSAEEEDNELLSGSGDDLSMSDNELKMSKKSKKKFDERKSKEQKKASREMYEARHNISSNSSKAEFTKRRKNKRQRLNSSALQSEEEIEVKSKKNKRMKIDSSQDSSTGDIKEDHKHADANISMSKEHEITSVCEESMNKNDPLSMNVKTEPLTPLKDLNMSTVCIVDKIEEVHIDQNGTIMKSNETSDALQEDSDASSISENMEISSNYDSVLKELNKEVEKKKIKSLDISLNLNKKKKQSAKDPIVDNLNLTNTKKSKRNVDKDKTHTSANTSQKLNSRRDTKNIGEFDESSSNSIDLQLLFSEDSSDSINKVSESKQDQQNEPENFIPLRRTEAKTKITEENTENVPNNQDMNTSNNQSQVVRNTSMKKQKKKDSLSTSEDTHNITANQEISLTSIFNTSSKKKKYNISNDDFDLNVSQKISSENIYMNASLNNNSKKNNISVSDANGEDDNATNIKQLKKGAQNQTINDISMNSTLKTSTKNKKNSIPVDKETNNANGASNKNDHNQSINISTKKKKKKNSISVSDETSDANDENTTNVTQTENDPNQSINVSTKKKNSISISDETSDANDENTTNVTQNEIDPNQSINTNSKKKKKKNSVSVCDETGNAKDENTTNVTQTENDPNQSINTSTKKKNNKYIITVSNETESATNVDNAINQNEHIVSQINQNISLNNSLNTSSKKRKKKHSISVTEKLDGDTEDNPVNKEPEVNFCFNKGDISMNTTLNISSKKNKKKTSISVSEDVDDKNNISITNKIGDISCNKSSLDMSTNSALNTSSKKKKKNRNRSEIDSEGKIIEVSTVQSDFNNFDKSASEISSSKKKKKHNDSVVADLTLASSPSVAEKVNDSLNTSAKKKNNTKTELQDIGKDSQNCDSDAPEEIPYASHKNISAGDNSGGAHIFIDTEGNQDWNNLITSGSSKKKNKKKKELHETPSTVNEIMESNNEATGKSNKRKRKSSANSQESNTSDPDHKLMNDSVYVKNKRKKQKTSQSEDILTDIKDTDKKQNKKRKERDDDDSTITSKVFKQNASDKLSVPRLPSTILNQLEDKPRKEVLQKKKAKVVSTTQFVVEEAQKRKNKPSNYLEESVYLNDSVDEKKQKGFIKIPKVLPFMPTATISGSGFTTKFQINVLAKETKFVAQTSNITGFKNEYLSKKKIKKAGTYEMYKSQRNRKMSKF